METTEIKRYSVVINPHGENSMLEYPQGEWVRWEDVIFLVKKAEIFNKLVRYQIKHRDAMGWYVNDLLDALDEATSKIPPKIDIDKE